jgi:integrase
MDIGTLLKLNHAHVARGHLATGSGFGSFHRFRHSATILENNNTREIQNLLRRSNGDLPNAVDILQVTDLLNSIASREDAETCLERQNWSGLLLG